MALISSSLTISSSSNLFDCKAPFQSSASSPQSVSLSTLPSLPLLSQNHAPKTTSHCKFSQDIKHSRGQSIINIDEDQTKIRRFKF